ncbi:MAG: hypothetical protein HC893_14990 [Chloroflexaceae bacterium]|nr:hypothetical protein [Chloroflexaceae bacterium]
MAITPVGTNVRIGTPGTTRVIIYDDDNIPEIFIDARSTLTEGESASFQVRLRASSSFTITVDYILGDDILTNTPATAQAGVNYTSTLPISGTLIFPPRTRNQDVFIQTIDNAVNEADKTFYLTLVPDSARGGNIQSGRGQTTISLLDNDGPAVFFSSPTYTITENAGVAPINVRLSFAAPQAIRVRCSTTAITAQPGQSYEDVAVNLDFAPFETSKVCEVPILNNDQSNEDGTVRLTLSNPSRATLGVTATVTLTILSDLPIVEFSASAYTITERVSSTLIAVTAHFNSPISQETSVIVSTSDGTATANQDYRPLSTTLVFSPVLRLDATSVFTPVLVTQTVMLDIVQDLEDEAPETILLNLSNPQVMRLGAQQPALLTLLDAPPNIVFLPALIGPPPTVQYSTASYVVQESAGTAAMSITLRRAIRSPVIVEYSTFSQPGTGNSAIPGRDYITTTGQLTFEPGGSTTQQFTVPIIDDQVRDGTRVAILLLDVVSGEALLGAPASATLQILDNDRTTTSAHSATSAGQHNTPG